MRRLRLLDSTVRRRFGALDFRVFGVAVLPGTDTSEVANLSRQVLRASPGSALDMFCIRAAQPARLQAQFAPKRPQTSRAFRMAQPAQASLDYPLNFGAGTSFDQVVFGAVRPGGSKAAGPFQPEVVDEWAAAMKKEGITRVVSLLDESELTLYAKPLGDLYGKHFKR